MRWARWFRQYPGCLSNGIYRIWVHHPHSEQKILRQPTMTLNSSIRVHLPAVSLYRQQLLMWWIIQYLQQINKVTVRQNLVRPYFSPQRSPYLCVALRCYKPCLSAMWQAPRWYMELISSIHLPCLTCLVNTQYFLLLAADLKLNIYLIVCINMEFD